MKKSSIILLSLGLVLIVYLLVNSLSNQRSSYYTYDFANTSHLQSFNQEFAAARQTQEAWISDPVAIALRVAGYPNLDRIEPDEVKVSKDENNMVSVVIKKFNLMDDSVRHKEVRVDLVSNQNTWEIEWAGAKWKCARDFSFGWTSRRCS